MKARHLALLMLLALPPSLFAADSMASSLGRDFGSILSQLNFSAILENGQAAEIIGTAGGALGVQPPQNASQAMLPSGLAQLPAAAANAIPNPGFQITAGDIRNIALIALVLVYVFAAGKIAEFLRSTGKAISKREVLFAPFAYLFASGAGISIYLASGAWVPPQNTIITMGFYLLLIPLAITIGLGAAALHGLFRDRLKPWQSLDLSMRVILAPVFDGLAGYWVSFGAAAMLVFISGFTYWSSGGNFSLVTLDFLLLSSVVAIYFLYRAITSQNNEGRASNVVTLLIVLAPSLMRLLLKDVVCAGLSMIPLDFFRTCPLLQAGNEVTLSLSVLATLLVLVPAIPVIYALIVNLLRFIAVLEVLAAPEKKHGKAEGD